MERLHCHTEEIREKFASVHRRRTNRVGGEQAGACGHRCSG